MSNFVDEAGLNVKGGDGGAGCVSFRREAHVAMGGPDGGDGGRGGDVWLVADRNVASLLAFRDHPHRKATSGTHGSGKKQHGHGGEDLIVHVPIGTSVKDRDGEVLADLVHDGDRWLAAEGGIGGKGNAKFLSNKRRAPAFAEQGEVGQERWVWLELKLMADVALVGFPNVGKSTLISRISAARPKIADYPFTTLVPNLGVVRLDERRGEPFEMVVADIPGLIEGAAEGRGLGHQFLRHIERARALVILLDLSPLAEITPEEQERILLGELSSYRPDLLDRPRVRIGSRADTAEPGTLERFEGLAVSAVTGDGIPQLLSQLRTAVETARATEPEPEGFITLRPIPEGVRIGRRDDGSYEVLGRDAARAVGLSDLTNPDALQVARERLAKLGVDRALARAGARNGDIVHIAKFSFDYESDVELDVQPFDERAAASRPHRHRDDGVTDVAGAVDGGEDWDEDDWDADAALAAALAADDELTDEDLTDDEDEPDDGDATEVIVVRRDRS
ncbi:MAG: GTPase ObgE [Microthrixaceae bacterium]